MSINDDALALAGYEKVYDYTQYSHENHVNVIPEESFKHLVMDAFKTMADVLRNTYGPYASTVIISDQSQTTTTKDGYNVFNAMGFSHAYKRMVYLAVKKIIDRVNNNVGDGTTSCILLAEKMFLEIEKIIKTVDDKRNILAALTQLEKALQDPEAITDDLRDELIQPLNNAALRGLIDVAGNYDTGLTDIIEKALDPELVGLVESDQIISVRNVVVEAKLDPDGEGFTTYECDYLPGDYRVRVDMGTTEALMFESPRKIRVALYDHAFGASDWNFFMDKYDKVTETLILARSFNRSFMDHEFTQYLLQLRSAKADVPLFLAEIKGDFVRDEIKDLGAVLNFEPIGLHAKSVNHEKLPIVPVQVHKGNCMCFWMDEIPKKYIETLKSEMETDLSGSMVRHQLFKDRIRALSNESHDTLITVNASSTLEMKMISDKIDDCVSIVNSAVTYGIVPNMFAYGYMRLDRYKNACTDDISKSVADAVMLSIKGLFSDIWKSKHGDEFPEKCDVIAKDFYENAFTSFDIIKESYVPVQDLPTSAQYDLEVITAALSIVKYLLTSRALVFDAHLLKPIDDTGKYRLAE